MASAASAVRVVQAAVSALGPGRGTNAMSNAMGTMGNSEGHAHVRRAKSHGPQDAEALSRRARLRRGVATSNPTDRSGTVSGELTPFISFLLFMLSADMPSHAVFLAN